MVFPFHIFQVQQQLHHALVVSHPDLLGPAGNRTIGCKTNSYCRLEHKNIFIHLPCMNCYCTTRSSSFYWINFELSWLGRLSEAITAELAVVGSNASILILWSPSSFSREIFSAVSFKRFIRSPVSFTFIGSSFCNQCL